MYPAPARRSLFRKILSFRRRACLPRRLLISNPCSKGVCCMEGYFRRRSGQSCRPGRSLLLSLRRKRMPARLRAEGIQYLLLYVITPFISRSGREIDSDPAENKYLHVRVPEHLIGLNCMGKRCNRSWSCHFAVATFLCLAIIVSRTLICCRHLYIIYIMTGGSSNDTFADAY